MTEISFDELENSKVFVSKSETFKFMPPMDYLRPFVDIISPLNPEWKIYVEKEVENAEEDGTKNTAYGRVALRAKLPAIFDLNLGFNSQFNHAYSEIGIVYALDTTKPEMRVANGKRVSVCTNQCIFGSDNITSVLLTSTNREKIYRDTNVYVQSLEEETQRYKQVIERMYENVLVGDRQINERIGKIFRSCKKTNDVGINIASSMLGLLEDERSMYGIKNGETNDWIIYNALTESIKKSSIIDESSKVLFLEGIFNLN